MEKCVFVIESSIIDNSTCPHNTTKTLVIWFE